MIDFDDPKQVAALQKATTTAPVDFDQQATPPKSLAQRMLYEGPLGAVGRVARDVLVGSEAPAEAPATTTSGALGQAAQQFGYGLERTSAVGTLGRAAARAAGAPDKSTAPGTIPEYAGRIAGDIAGVGLDIAALPEMLGAGALGQGYNAVAKAVPKARELLTNVGKGVGLGATVGGAGGYAETGTAAGTTAGALGGAALGGATTTLPIIKDLAQRYNPFSQSGQETLAALRLGSEKGKLADAELNPEFQYVATETNPAARAQLAGVTRTPSGQEKLGGAVSRALTDTQQAAAGGSAPEAITGAANIPVQQDIKAAQQAQVAEARARADQAQAAAQQKAAQAGVAGNAVEAANAQAEAAHAALGDVNASQSELGRSLQVATRNKVDELERQRQTNTAPERRQLEQVLDNKGRDAVALKNAPNPEDPLDKTKPFDVKAALDSITVGGKRLGDMNVSGEAVDAANAAVPSLAQARKGNTLRSLLVGDEGDANSTHYDLLKIAEKELNNAKSAAKDASDYNGYDTALRAVRSALDFHTNDAESAYRAAFRQESEPLNQLLQGDNKFAPVAVELRKYETASTPAEQAEYQARAKKLLGSALANPDEATAKDLITVMGPQGAEDLVGHYYAQELRNATPEKIRDFTFKNKEFLSQFPEEGKLRTSLRDLADARETAQTAQEFASSAEKARLGERKTAAKVAEEVPATGEAPPELTKKLYSEQPEVAHAEINRVLDGAGSAKNPKAVEALIDLKDRLTKALGSKGAKVALTDAAKARMTTAITDELQSAGGPMQLSEARGVINRLSQTWDTARNGLVKTGALTDGEAKNVDTVLKNLRLMKDALRPATTTEAETGLAAYGASGADIAGIKAKFYLKPFKKVLSNIQGFVDDAMFDPQAMGKLAKRLDAAKTRAQKLKVFDANPVLKNLVAAHYASLGAAGMPQPPANEVDYTNTGTAPAEVDYTK